MVKQVTHEVAEYPFLMAELHLQKSDDAMLLNVLFEVVARETIGLKQVWHLIKEDNGEGTEDSAA